MQITDEMTVGELKKLIGTTCWYLSGAMKDRPDKRYINTITTNGYDSKSMTVSLNGFELPVYSYEIHLDHESAIAAYNALLEKAKITENEADNALSA